MRESIAKYLEDNLKFVYNSNVAALHFIHMPMPDIVPETVAFYKTLGKYEMVAWFSSELDLVNAVGFFSAQLRVQASDCTDADTLCFHITKDNDTFRFYFKDTNHV